MRQVRWQLHVKEGKMTNREIIEKLGGYLFGDMRLTLDQVKELEAATVAALEMPEDDERVAKQRVQIVEVVRPQDSDAILKIAQELECALDNLNGRKRHGKEIGRMHVRNARNIAAGMLRKEQ